MRIAYLDCFAGIAGDMFLGALLDAGVPEQVLHDAVHALHIGASLRVERVDRSGITSTKVHVLENGELADKQSHTHSHAHADSQATDEPLQQQPLQLDPLTPQLKSQHLHKGGHAHTHDHAHEHSHGEQESHAHEHTHGRSLTEIRKLLQASSLKDEVKQKAIRTFELLGASEAKIHNVPVDAIHFHEVGAVDAIVDIVASVAGIVHLQIGAWYSSPVNVGGGMVECAHGTFPVPAPATADLLRTMPTYSAHLQKELVTPTGAALLRMLDPTFGPQPAMQVEHIGYGAGTRNPHGFPNVLRLSVGQAAAGQASSTDGALLRGSEQQTVIVLETALDDASPQVLAYVTEQALAHGALDVMLAPVTMKKGRAGTLVTVLAPTEHSVALQQLLLRETTTLGLRIRQEQRLCLQREHVSVTTDFGEIRVKLGKDVEQVRNVAPEYEDCRRAALEHSVPLKQVQQAALAAYLRGAQA